MTEKKLQVLMLTDWMASSMGSQEEEYNDIQGYMTELFPEFTLTFQRDFHMHKFNGIPDSDWDVFVMDFGGLLPGCQDMVDSIYKQLVELTYKYPKKLFILWSTFTRRLYLDAVGTTESRRMIMDEMQGLISPNVVFWYEKEKQQRCRTFFELPKDIDPAIEKPYYKFGKPTELIPPTKRPSVGKEDQRWDSNGDLW
jgi:hypothetical protein